LNAGHPLIVNINKLRKQGDKKIATMVTRQLLDNVLAQSGIPFDVREGTERQY
jgi:flagellar basal body P-ring protein FlgI